MSIKGGVLSQGYQISQMQFLREIEVSKSVSGLEEGYQMNMFLQEVVSLLLVNL